MEWYSPARFGLFYHWGQFVGGGCAAPAHFPPEWHQPFFYPTLADFEAAAADPELIAENLVRTVTYVGAKYLIYTVCHSCDHYALMYPSQLDGFLLKTSHDYVGAVLRACRDADVRAILYIPGSPEYWDCTDGQWLAPGYREQAGYDLLLRQLVFELIDRYEGLFDGFWVDIYHHEHIESLSELIHALLPHAIVTLNNDTSLHTPDIDINTTEITTGLCEPPYNRPSALMKPNQWGCLPPMPDFNEDIPTCNNWWHGSPYQKEDELLAGPYVQDPTFLVKQMVSSLGQCGQWNFALGIGPTINGTPPAMFQPALDNMHRFMRWAGESIYQTTGGVRAPLRQGWTIGGGGYGGWSMTGGFFSLTVSLADPNILYAHITTAPESDHLCIQHAGRMVVAVTDLHTGQPLPFTQRGCINIHVPDWQDVAEYGDTVLKITLAPTMR